MRGYFSGPATKADATSATSAPARTANLSCSGIRGDGAATFSWETTDRARRTCRSHSTEVLGSASGFAMASPIVVAGRCAMPESRSSRVSASFRVGDRSRPMRQKFQSSRSPKPLVPMIRAQRGVSVQRPAHATIRKAATRTANGASAGQRRSQPSTIFARATSLRSCSCTPGSGEKILSNPLSALRPGRPIKVYRPRKFRNRRRRRSVAGAGTDVKLASFQIRSKFNPASREFYRG